MRPRSSPYLPLSAASGCCPNPGPNPSPTWRSPICRCALVTAHTYPCQGGNPQSARKSKLPDRPRRRRQSTVRWYRDPVPMAPPSPSRPPLGQQQHGLPPLPGRRRHNHPPSQIPGFHLPLFEKPLYLPHTHHRPPSTQGKLIQFLHNFTPCLCTFHLGFGLVVSNV